MKAKNKLVILPAAQDELEEIANTHMALVGAASAKKIGKRIHDAIGRLCDHPQMGIAFPVGELSRAGYRNS